MRLADFFAGVDLHDSMIEQIIYDESAEALLITIDFLSWRQPAYDEATNAESITRVLHFTGVTSYETVPGVSVFRSNEILEVKTKDSMDGDHVTFLVYNEGFGDVIALHIQAEHAAWLEQ